MFRSLIAFAVATMALAACMHLEPAPSFVQQLNARYQSLADGQNKVNYDWTDKAYFRTKGQRALAGKDVQPEEPTQWGISDDRDDIFPELNNAYDMLQIALVMDQKKVTSPVAAADAQAYFDCWVEQAQEKFTPEAQHGNSCRPAFYEAFCRMYGGSCNKAPIDKDRIFRVYFDTNMSNIDAEDRAVILQAVDSYKTGGGSAVIVAGHADRVGKPGANLVLSKNRADAVARTLVAHGIPAAVISDKYFGENQPLVPTADEVPNPNNRRVLIVIR